MALICLDDVQPSSPNLVSCALMCSFLYTIYFCKIINRSKYNELVSYSHDGADKLYLFIHLVFTWIVHVIKVNSFVTAENFVASMFQWERRDWWRKEASGWWCTSQHKRFVFVKHMCLCPLHSLAQLDIVWFQIVHRKLTSYKRWRIHPILLQQLLSLLHLNAAGTHCCQRVVWVQNLV